MALQDDLVEKIQILWGELTESELPTIIAHKYLYYAIQEVEGIDFPRDVEFSFSGGLVSFTDPNSVSLASQVLYVWKALLFVQTSKEGRLIQDGGGVEWRSGTNVIKTEGAAMTYRERKKFMERQYDSKLQRAMINDLNDEGAFQIDVYYRESDMDIL